MTTNRRIIHDAINAIAKQVARDVFEVGDEKRGKATRIQFKLDDNGNQLDGGGLCESALEHVVSISLWNLFLTTRGIEQ